MTFAQFLRYSVAMATLATPVALQAQEGVYLLQLGSFEKKDAAQARWSVLQNKYPNLLESLAVRYMDVTLPPDNFTVYRTQAGALASRANAQSICDRLTAKGDECYVVETAMFNADDMAASVPNPPLQNTPMEISAASVPAKAPQVAAVAQAPAPKDLAHAMVPQKTEKLEKAVAAKEAALPAVKPLAQDSVPAVPNAPDVSAVMAPPAQMVASSEHAQTRALETAKVAATDASPAQVEEEGGFWSFMSALDPFSDDAPSAPPKQVTANVAPPKVDEVEVMSASDSASIKDPFAVAAAPAMPVAPAAAPVTKPAPLMGDLPQQPASAPAAPQAGYQVPSFEVLDKTATPSQGFTLPPPPAMSGAVAPAFAGQPAAPSQIQESSDVKVSEAVRVPLTDTAPISEEASLAAERTRLATPPMSMGTPSQEMPGMRTLWAQIGYFSDQQHALGYWENFRKANPTFPAVRVRITSPYMASSFGAPKVSLRVGPFDQGAYVKDICDEVIGSSKQAGQPLDCQSVADMNESAPKRTVRAAGTEARRENFYAKQNQTASEMYWVQVGSFASPTEADAFWQQLASAHKPTLDGIAPNIAPPIMSSSMEPVFRLRAGPYALRNPADTLCAKLQARGSQCLIVFSK